MARRLPASAMEERPAASAALALADCDDLPGLMSVAADIRDRGHGSLVSYSPKVFIPLTQLCRNVCHYCTFARRGDGGDAAYLTPDEVLEVARAGVRAGCREALFTLGDKPELRYSGARRALDDLGYASTADYLAAMAEKVHAETGLLPHINAGVLDEAALGRLRAVSVSQGLMLESAASRLCEPGGPHHGSPDKRPEARLGMIEAAGRLGIAMTSGILIGIGETRRERIESLLALRDLDDRHGHIQEIIIQNFRAKPNTRMADTREPSLDELCWTIAVARIIFGAEANIQAPPNLSPQGLKELVGAGINDLGGISPVTQDYVNPEAPWPHLRLLASATETAGKTLVARLPLYPKYVHQASRWLDDRFLLPVLNATDAAGYARSETWSAGEGVEVPELPGLPHASRTAHFLGSPSYRKIEAAAAGRRLDDKEIAALFQLRGGDMRMLCAAADELRLAACGDEVSYVANCNINYTNICAYACQFCAFSKQRIGSVGRERGYNMSPQLVAETAAEAWRRGADEVCLQGGIHPSYTGQTYLDICTAIREACPDLHIHAFSPLEVWQGARTLGVTLRDFLAALRDAGLGSLPGTAAEILDDEVRQTLCPDKVTVAEWLTVMRTAHEVGLRSTATIMYGHMETPAHWAKHLLLIRDLQQETGGFTEFVPLPFVHREAPLYRRALARPGPTFGEAVAMHAVARLALNPVIRNIQVSWSKMGVRGVEVCLQAGANDLGGTLMNESISRAAGGRNGQEMKPAVLEALIHSIGRRPSRRDTLYRSGSRRPYLGRVEAKVRVVGEPA